MSVPTSRTCAPRLFGGPADEGPLDIVWDTSILIDYFVHGSAMWKAKRFDTNDEVTQPSWMLCSALSNLGCAGICAFASLSDRSPMHAWNSGGVAG